MTNNNQLPADVAQLVDHNELFFDAGDKANGSLYLCVARGENAPQTLINELHAAGLWSGDAAKQVAEDQRDAYKAGLELVAVNAFQIGTQGVILARCDHPKFPSDAARYAAWLSHCETTHGDVS